MDIFNLLKQFFGLTVDWSTLSLSGLLYQMFLWVIVFMIVKVIFQSFFKFIEYCFKL